MGSALSRQQSCLGPIAQPDPVLAGPFRGMILGVDRKHRLCLRTETGVDYEIPYAIES